MPLLLLVKNAIGAIALYYLKKHAPELVFNASVESLEKLASYTSTNIDDDAVSKLRADKEEYIAIIRKLM